MLDVLIGDKLPLSLAPFDEIRFSGRDIASDGPWGPTEIGSYHEERISVARWMLPRGEDPEQHELTVSGEGERLRLYVGDKTLGGQEWPVVKIRAYPGSLQLLGEVDGEWRLLASCVSRQWRSAGGTPLYDVVRLVSTSALKDEPPFAPDASPRGRLSGLAERDRAARRATVMA